MKKVYSLGFCFFVVLLLSLSLVSFPKDSFGLSGSGGGPSPEKPCESDKKCPPASEDEEDACDTAKGFSTTSADQACRDADADAKQLCEGRASTESSCETYCKNCDGDFEYPPDSGRVYTCKDDISCTCEIPTVTISTTGGGTPGFLCTVKCCGRCCCENPRAKKDTLSVDTLSA